MNPDEKAKLIYQRYREIFPRFHSDPECEIARCRHFSRMVGSGSLVEVCLPPGRPGFIGILRTKEAAK